MGVATGVDRCHDNGKGTRGSSSKRVGTRIGRGGQAEAVGVDLTGNEEQLAAQEPPVSVLARCRGGSDGWGRRRDARLVHGGQERRRNVRGGGRDEIRSITRIPAAALAVVQLSHKAGHVGRRRRIKQGRRGPRALPGHVAPAVSNTAPPHHALCLGGPQRVCTL
jgi:hypothetical protein